MGTGPRYKRIGDMIFEDVRQKHAASVSCVQLKPARELAREYQASFGTVKRAIRYLIEKGRCVKRGPRAFFLVWASGGIADGEFRDRNAETAFAQGIREKILSGEYRSGMQLPKSDYFTLTFNVSSHTVAGALKLLAREGLVHKQGRRWIVGKPPASDLERVKQGVQTSYGPDRPVVVAIARNPNRFASLSTNPVYQPFFSTLLDDFALNGYKLTVCYTDEMNPLCRGICGVEAIAAYTAGLRSHYAGTFFLGSEVAFTPELMETLLALEKPVLWFDVNDHSRAREYARLHTYRDFVVCRLDQKKSVKTALEYLHECGHRVIGIPDPLPLATNPSRGIWMRDRIANITSAARSFVPPLACYRSRQTEHLFAYTDSTDKYSNLWKPDTGADETTSVRTLPLDEVPSLRYLIKECGVTAICACNDFFARDYYHWMERVGIAVPEDISLISFDNSYAALPLGLTSVDFGLGYLASQTAGVLMDRIAVPVGRPPTLWSRPLLIRRRSVKKISPKRTKGRP